MGSLHMTTETAVLIETFKALGAESALIARATFTPPEIQQQKWWSAAGVPVFAWKGETLESTGECT